MDNYEFSLKRLWLIPILMFLIIMLLVAFDSPFFNTKKQYGVQELVDGWDVINENTGASFKNIALTKADIGIAGNYKPVTMNCTLPSKRIPSGALIFRTYYCSVEVYLDGELIYTYAKDILEKGHMCPKHYNVVPLPDNYQGREVTIVLMPNEVYSFSGFAPIYFGNVEETYRTILESKRLPLLIGTFLCIFGLAMFITSLYLFVYHNGNITLIFAANISFDIGTYILSFNDLYLFIADADEFYTFIEYIALFCIPLSIIVFLIASNSYFRNWVFYLVAVLDVLIIAYTVTMHLLNINHICNYLSILHFVGISEAVLFIVRLIMSIVSINKKKDDEEDIVLGVVKSKSTISSLVFLIGVIIFLICVIVDISLYIIRRDFGTNFERHSNINFFIIGSLCFVLSILLNYFFLSIEHISVENSAKHLKGLAYTDDLTGLSNRARCELEIASLGKKNREGFSIISIDVDKLKTVNDTMGHQMGDKLLKVFSDAFKEALNDADLLGRMGGDEFIAIYKKGSESLCRRAMNRLVEEVDRCNSKQTEFELSFSYGYAICKNGRNKNPRNVYMEADKKMYEMKKIHHKERESL